MTCNKCIHYDVCDKQKITNRTISKSVCKHFKDKSLFVELPCKVGGTVYRIVKLCNGETKIVEGEVLEFTITHEHHNRKDEYRFYFWAKGEEIAHRQYSLWCYFTDFGKTVFLTKEEAEEKLKELEGRK
ncbi:MAG: hypothetical protein IJ445_06975 [Clostridia bacterium]|nr:hypothetical protein [Clostridia bacterium]